MDLVNYFHHTDNSPPHMANRSGMAPWPLRGRKMRNSHRCWSKEGGGEDEGELRMRMKDTTLRTLTDSCRSRLDLTIEPVDDAQDQPARMTPNGA